MSDPEAAVHVFPAAAEVIEPEAFEIHESPASVAIEMAVPAATAGATLTGGPTS